LFRALLISPFERARISSSLDFKQRAEDSMDSDEALKHYRHLRALTNRHQNSALDCLARPAVLRIARSMGMVRGRSMLAESNEEMSLILDLAAHTAGPGRSRAIDRYAKAIAGSVDADEMQLIEAICAAQFSIWRIERRHEVAGLVVTDMMRDRETWLMDEALTGSAEEGVTFAARLCWPADFAISCGVLVPVYRGLMEGVFPECARWLATNELAWVAGDPKFAAAVYRHAIEAGTLENVRFKEVAAAA
jgi:hypothetical protein